MRLARRPRAARAAVLTTVVAAGLGLSACGGNAQALAQQACIHVNRSIAYYVRSTRPGTPQATAALLLRKADSELRAALPLAAQATSADGSWNALMTTISEGADIDEGHLIPSLRAQCVVADTNQNVNPQSPASQSPGSQSPGSTVPQNVNPKPAAGG